MPDPTDPSGQLCRIPRGYKPFAATVTGNTVFGVPSVTCSAFPTRDRADAEQAVRECMKVGRMIPLLGDTLPEMDMRLTVFEMPLDSLARMLMANGYRVQPPPARVNGQGS